MDINVVSFSQTFPLKGEGTIIVNRRAEKPFAIKISPLDQPHIGYVALQISHEEATFWGKVKSEPRPERLLTLPNIGYDTKRKVGYWFSFNRDDRVLKYGKGYIMEGTTLMTYSFPDPETPDTWSFLFAPQVSKTIRIVENFVPDRELEECRLQSMVDAEKAVNFYPYPLITDWPYVVKNSKNATMFDIASDDYILSASLPATCQELYNNVVSHNVDLDWPHTDSDDKLSEAIGYSIATKGKILYNKLKEKKERGDMLYLRVTLGYDRGSSPGIPYVLEIWPPLSYSPIHNHGNAYAVIKVLHGNINIGIYNKTWPDSENPEELIKRFQARKGNVTWISPNWYQTHQLKNESSEEYCATIQCYKYGDDDHLKWPYFDYLDDKHVEEFKPVSDFEFKDLRTKLLAEYKEAHGSK